ncbi:MAG: carbohydrate ABC transporter permease [Clostridium sp.]
MKRVCIKGLKYGLLILWAIVILVPILTVLIGSFKSYSEFNSTGGLEFSVNPTLENYERAFFHGKMLLGFINSFILVLGGCLGTIILGSMVAFCLNRFDFKFKKAILLMYILVSIVPIEISQVTTFKIINNLGLYNTRIAPIILYMSIDMVTLFIYMQMLEKIPRDIDRAYILEGGTVFGLFKEVIFKILRPATFTVCLLKMISIYNDFYIPYLYMPKEGLNTVSQTIFKFMSTSKIEWNVICAGVIISIIPMVILFVFLQNKIYSGIVEGSVKG